MKKTVKRIFALVLVIAACLCFCSCREIKEMRASQAFYGENGDIVWGDQVYKSLEVQELPRGLEFNIYSEGVTTEKDVPVLLADTFGQQMYYNHNKTLIEAGGYYAREDLYDYVLDLIKFPYITDYCIEVGYDGSYNTGYQLLKQRYITAFEEIIYGGMEINIEGYDYYDIGIITDYVGIYKCDKEMVFQTLAYEIEELEDGELILIRHTQEYDYYVQIYRVPDDKKAIMRELLTLGEDGLF